MPKHPSHASRSPVIGKPHRSVGRGVAALAVAVFALLAVIATLVVIGHRTRSIREEIIQTVEPARNELYELQRLLALQEAEQRGGTPPRVLRGTLPDAAAARPRGEVALTRLRALAIRGSAETVEAFADLRARVQRWQASLDESELAPGSAELLAATRADYAQVLSAADRLHQVLNLEAEERRERLRRLARFEVGLIVGMVVLTLIAVVVMWRVSRRQAELVQQTQRLAAESERRRVELERVAEEKAQFIRGITHDLKNPIGAIDAYAELLEAEIKGTLSDDERHYVGRIRNAARQMLTTIQDLLELARAEASEPSVDPRPVDLTAVVRDVATDFSAAAEAAGLSLEEALDEELPPVATDARRVREVLGNLLSNAVKYTPPGGRVTITTERVDNEAIAGEAVAVRVRDTGPGIPEDAQRQVFEEFERLDEGSKPGSGVGLAISQRMARLIGGELTLESRVGEGSTFTLWIPMSGAPGSAEPAPGG